jgi:hypothetical protein
MFPTFRMSHVRILPALLVLTLVTAGAHAQQATPRPAPEIQRMTALAGTFMGEAEYTAGGKTTKFTLHHDNRIVADGFGLATHETAEIPGLGHYEAQDLFGWDAGRGELHLYSVTNDPISHDHAGRFSDAHHATLRYEGVQDGKKLVEVIPMEILGPDEYRFRSTTTVAGEAPEVFVATMKRVTTSSAR